jgi:squalene synthase HpnD
MTVQPQAEPDDSALQAQVSGSSFYAAMRIMPKAEREAMFAIYRFCRMVDDIADDGTRARPQRAAELDGWRADLAALYDGRPAGRAAFLEQSVHAFGLRQADFLAVVDGMDMDVATDIQAPDLATLDLYCDRVACAVGRLSTRIFGMDEKPGLELASELGRALQLTNILRDLDEDAAMGRLYLPGELLRQAGVTTTEPHAAIGDARVDGACRALAERALVHFAAADRLMRSRPRGRLLAPKVMEAVYRTILQQMLVEGWVAPRRRVRIGKRRLLWIVARCALLG